MTDALLKQLLTRASNPKLVAPGPDETELADILRAGWLAPDHKYLRPTRVHVIAGDRRTALGDVFARAALSDDPDASSGSLEKLRVKPLRAPLILAVGCRPRAHPKVPEIEQISATAAAVVLMQTAADTLGYSSMWRTGPMAYHPLVKRAFDLSAGDHLLAFLYIGTADAAPKQRQTMDLKSWVKHF